MPKQKWSLNTIYISERLQESLRPISRCRMTTVVAPMGYGKTTAVSWFLEQRAKAEAVRIIRISVYSGNLMIFWKSVQDAFARAGLDFLRDYACPTDAVGGGILADGLCHELAGKTPCYRIPSPAIFSSTIFTCSRMIAPARFCARLQTVCRKTCI